MAFYRIILPSNADASSSDALAAIMNDTIFNEGAAQQQQQQPGKKRFGINSMQFVM